MNLDLYTLPEHLDIGGRAYRLRTDFRAVLDVLTGIQDPELDEWGQACVMIRIMLPEWRDLPVDFYPEACEKISAFIDFGMEPEQEQSPRLMDWRQDAPILIPGINKVAGKEIRAERDLHWWTFMAYYLEIGEGVFSYVVGIRDKQVKHKKLDKEEREFYRKNKSMVDLHTTVREEIRQEKDRILQFLDG
ncbi:MAG: hypothetical protein IJY28_01520 [Clostridia bacterium]|nr:hypothetical protein [Clostridia bacterium]